jgi:hypothetical protein
MHRLTQLIDIAGGLEAVARRFACSSDTIRRHRTIGEIDRLAPKWRDKWAGLAEELGGAPAAASAGAGAVAPERIIPVCHNYLDGAERVRLVHFRAGSGGGVASQVDLEPEAALRYAHEITGAALLLLDRRRARGAP